MHMARKVARRHKRLKRRKKGNRNSSAHRGLIVSWLKGAERYGVEPMHSWCDKYHWVCLRAKRGAEIREGTQGTWYLSIFPDPRTGTSRWNRKMTGSLLDLVEKSLKWLVQGIREEDW